MLLLLILNVLTAPVDANAASLGKECQGYLSVKGFSTPTALEQSLRTSGRSSARCSPNATAQRLFAPNPLPPYPGVTDTTSLQCRYGNPQMWDSTGTCCGLRPHFNWVLATCEETQPAGQFCWNMPKCLLEGSPKINYVAAYQFDGNEFVLLDESSAGELNGDGIYGNFWETRGFSALKSNFRTRAGDWTTKYAAWAKGDGVDGPRGITPPAGLWVLSAENFYYGAFYFLSQLGINLEGKELPTGTPCWSWEFDAVEGTAGWSPGSSLPGNLNMHYVTNNAQASGCMPVAYSSKQANAFRPQFEVPEDYQDYCRANPVADGCQPWQENISWSGGGMGTHRFENLWDEPYIFAVVVDAKGYWTYRWRPLAYGSKHDGGNGKRKSSASRVPGPGGGTGSGWSGIERFRAARKLPARPTPVKDPRGLRTDVRGDVAEAVILEPSLSLEASCLRASIEAVNWQFGSNALAAMARELGQDGPGGQFEGAQNWWVHFADTGQNAGYPLSVAGIDASKMTEALNCNDASRFSCQCAVSGQEVTSDQQHQQAEEEVVFL